MFTDIDDPLGRDLYPHSEWRNLEAYARKQFTAHRQTMKPEVNQEILKKEWSRRKLPYCTYIPDKVAHMPGRESTSTGEWMRLIENGGYQHVM